VEFGLYHVVKPRMDPSQDISDGSVLDGQRRTGFSCDMLNF